jgi:3-dehydroquinate dehydratase-2
MIRILVINGPNLNLLGKRSPLIYGDKTLQDLQGYVTKYFEKVKVDFFQSNHEGQIIEKLHESATRYNGIVLNAGAFSHYSYALRDAIEAIDTPVVEVHISNTAAREPFRHQSVITAVCQGSIQGFGFYSYILAVRAIAHNSKRKE